MSETATIPDPSAVLATAGWEGHDFKQITSGWDNLIWRFTGADGRAHALRMARIEEGPSAQEVYEREASVLGALAGSGLPIPAIEARGTFEGAPFMVQQWLPGVPMIDRLAQRPWLVTRFGRYLGRLHARIHSLPTGNLPRLPDHAWITAIDPYSPELVERIGPDVTADAVCHMDLHPLNVLVNNDRISGVVDWTNGVVADRRMDLALTDALLRITPLPRDPLRPHFQMMRGRLASGWRHGYTAATGSWPLTPAFRALGAIRHFSEIDRAVREGRGWVTAAEVEGVRRQINSRLKDAGLPPLQR
jgi:aminoglycoside phosphotransferase (APT) family kinase protein